MTASSGRFGMFFFGFVAFPVGKREVLHHVFVLHPGGGDVFEFDFSFARVRPDRLAITFSVCSPAVSPINFSWIVLFHLAAALGAALRSPRDFLFGSIEEDFDVLEARLLFRRAAFFVAVGRFDVEVVDGKAELVFLSLRFFLPFAFLFGHEASWPPRSTSGLLKSTFVVVVQVPTFSTGSSAVTLRVRSPSL